MVSGANRIGSYIAEREALAWALLWRGGQHVNTPTIFRSDSQLAPDQAGGRIGALDCDESFQFLRGRFQILETALQDGCLLLDHILGLSNDPFNEFCDLVAKQEARGGFYRPRPHMDLQKWKKIVPYLWLLFAKEFGAPTFCGTGFDVGPPRSAICL